MSNPLLVADVPLADRLDLMRERCLRASAIPNEFRSPDLARLSSSSSLERFGPILLIAHEGAGMSLHRTPALARDDAVPHLNLSVLLSGTTRHRQYGHEFTAVPGQLVASWSIGAYDVCFDGRSARYSFQIPLDVLGLPYALIRSQLGGVLADGHPIGALVAAFLVRTGSAAHGMSDAERDALFLPIVHLVRALFTASAGDGFAGREPLAATLATRILEYLQAHLADPALSADEVAAAHGISVRTLYSVLARMEVSLGDWIRRARLARAAETLADPASALVSVAGIARSSGFSDTAHFSRAFRTAYGMPPGQWRRDRLADAAAARAGERPAR